MKHTLKKLLAALLACLMLLSNVALADETSTVTAGEGETKDVGNVTVQAPGYGDESLPVNAVEVSDGGTVNVTGDVTVSGENGYGIKADNGTVTVTGNVAGGSGSHDNGVSANGSTITVDGAVTGGACGVMASNESTVKVTGDVTGNTNYGVTAYEDSMVTVDGDVTGGTSGVVAAYGGTVTVGTDENKSTVEGGSFGVTASDEGTVVTVNGDAKSTDDFGYGVDADNKAQVNVTGDVKAEGKNGNGVNATHGSIVEVGGSVEGGDIGITVKGGTVIVGTEGENNTVTGGSYGVNASFGGNITLTGDVNAYNRGVQAEGENTEVNVTGDVTSEKTAIYARESSKVTVDGDVKVEKNGGLGHIGIEAYGEGTEVNVTGNVTATGFESDAIHAESGSKVTVGTEENESTVTSEYQGVYATMDNTTVTVNGSVESEKGSGVNANQGGTVNVTGNVTSSEGYGVSASGGTVNVDGNVESGSSIGINANGSDVTVGGDVVGGVNGIITTNGTNIQVKGSVKGESFNGITATGSNRVMVLGGVEGGKDGVSVGGDGAIVKVLGGVEGGERGVVAEGINVVEVTGDVTGGTGAGVEAQSDATVTVFGDVTSTGSVGMDIAGDKIFDPSQEDVSPTTVIVTGTVSGKDGAIVVSKSKTTTEINNYANGNPTETKGPDTVNYTTGNIDLTVWKAEGEDAIRVVDTTVVETTDWDTEGNRSTSTSVTYTTDAEATETFLAKVSYIIKKVGENIASAKVRDDQTVFEGLYTAHENEDVKLALNLAEGEVLEGVYYDGEDETTLTEAKDLRKDDSGNILVAMRRFGGMLNSWILSKIS